MSTATAATGRDPSGGRAGGFPRARLARLAAARPVPDLAAGYWVYGAGGFGRALAAELARLGLTVLGFVDRRARAIADEARCLHPDDLARGGAAGARLAYGVMNHATPAAEVTAWAAGCGFVGVHFPGDFYAIPGFAPPSYWLADPRTVAAALPHFEELHDALVDDESRRVLADLTAYRITTDPRLHPALAPGEPYFPDFLAGILPSDSAPVTFVDGGAYDGDTLDALMRSGLPLREWLAFEPDPGNARALAARVEALGPRLPAHTIVAAGLGARGGLARFEASAAAASRVLDPGEAGGSGTVAIRVVALDEGPFGRGPPAGPLYIKLDIEGAEADALRGMAQTLRGRPVLAISVYHRPSDIWRIPRLVRNFYPAPRMRLRQHGHHGFDTVLYVSEH